MGDGVTVKLFKAPTIIVNPTFPRSRPLYFIHRFKRVSCGILLSQDDSLLDSSNSRNGAQNVKSGGEALRVLFPNGFVSLHYVNEVTFRLPRWLHSPFIRDSSGACPESTALVEKSSLYISSDAVRMLESMSVNPKAAIYHLLEFLKSTEQYEIEFKRNFMGLHSTILSLEGKEHRLLANRLAGPQDDYNFSVIEAARLVFYNDTSMKDLSIIPTGGELLSTFKYLMKNSLLFTPRALDNTQLRQDLVFRARSPPEIGSMFWLENEILGERAAGKPGFQDYVEVMQSDLYTKFARHTPWYRNSSRSATLDSFLSKVKQRLLDPSYKISSLEQTDLFICQQIKEAIVSPAHFASESARLIEAAVLKPLAPLLVKGPRPRNSHDVFVEAGARVLVAVGVWPVWMTFQFVKSLMKYSGKATMFDGASQGADWIDQAFQASEKWASHILKSSSETLKCISTTPATASSTSPPLSPPSLPPPSSTPGGSMDSKFLQSLEPLLVLPSNNCRPGSSILNGLDTLSTDSVATSRVDCHSTVFVIDDPTAHELDDGISIEPLDPSKANSPDLSDYWVKIHIADPTALVMADSPVALVAQIRATTAYFPEKHHPMMPDQLSDERFNLSIRGAYALTFSARVSGIGEIIDYKVEPSVLRSVEKCHYNDVDKILDWSGIEGIDINGQGSSSSIGGDFAPWVTQTLLAKAPMFTHTSTNITPALVLEKDKSSTLTAFPRGWVERNRAKLLMLQRIAKAHTSHRVANGAMGRSSPSYHLSVTPYNPKYDGDTTIHLDPYRDSTLSPSHNMVSEFMVIAGRVAAKFCTEHKLSVPFRGQVSMYDVPLEAATRVVGDSHGFSLTPTVGSFLRQLPPNNSFKELAEFVAAARCSVSGNMSYFEYNKILRYMPPATIDLRPIQHFSMGIPGVNPLSTSSSSSTSPFMHSSMNGYLKATSPLRRYSDMIVHWQIKSKLAQLSSGATLPSFNEADLKRLIPRLHAKEKISKISSMQDRSWLLEWCRRREEMAQTLSRDCVSDGSFESGLVSRDRHRGIGLKNTNMTIKRGGLLETAWSIANVADPVQSARPVYTGVVCNVPDPGSTGRSDYHVMLTELGGFVAKLHSTDIVRYNIGDIVSCRVENINSFRGQVSVKKK